MFISIVHEYDKWVCFPFLFTWGKVAMILGINKLLILEILDTRILILSNFTQIKSGG